MKRRRQVVTAAALDRVFSGAALIGRMHPMARRRVHGLDVLRDLAYRDGGSHEHMLDVYRPTSPGPWPVVVYLHGGSFRVLSKDSHWMMGVQFARAGYLTVLPNYRLSPRSKFPAALEDIAHILRWVRDNVADHGGDIERLVLAGESAGANLTLAVCISLSWQRPEPVAQEIRALGVRPRVAAPVCGILQVTRPERFAAGSFVVRDRIAGVSDAYLPAARDGCELADPLVVLERAEPPELALPPIFTAAGTADPILDDTRRLGAALSRLGAEHQVRYYEGETHAFQLVWWREAAQRFWRDQLAFLAAHSHPHSPTRKVAKSGSCG